MKLILGQVSLSSSSSSKSPLRRGWGHYLASPKGEVVRGLEQFYHGITGNPTLNIELVTLSTLKNLNNNKRKVEINIISGLPSSDSTSPSGGGWYHYPASSKGEVLKGLEQFFYNIAS